MKLSGKTELVEYIKEFITKKGAISFRDFMEIALYYPYYGYYTSDKDKIGGFGDYFTSSELDPIFGQLLAKQFIEIYQRYFDKQQTQIVELGSGKGYLLHDVIRYIKESYPEIYQNIKFISVEKSDYHRQLQKELLKDFDNIEYFPDISDLPKIKGIIYSNELFDAIPTHMIKVRDGKVYEVYLTLDKEDEVVEIEREIFKEIRRYIEDLSIELPDNITTEINIDAIKVISMLADKLEKGFIFTIDYGYPSRELYKPYRNRGTLICYYKHTYNENYYQNVGLQDITSHVNFSALSYYGEKSGLKTVGFTDQAHFLVNLGLAEELNNLYEKGDYKSYERANRLKTLILPKGMGEKFKILIQSKNIENPQLEGLKITPPQTDRYKL
ncbi:MAG: SAM-dependent methyltransferase [Hydrogenothermaceae bacterium]|nr:SAM-dependent methyltransferase [Hydrogenothermaceae bacterium]